MDLKDAISKYSAEHPNTGEKEDFQEFVNFVLDDCDVSIKKFQRVARVSSAAVERWQAGNGLPPYSTTRRAVVNDLTRVLSKS